MNVTDAVTRALPAATDLDTTDPGAYVDVNELTGELELVAQDALRAQHAGIGLGTAVHDPRFPVLQDFHQGLRDALLVELPPEVQDWVEEVASPTGASRLGALHDRLVTLARDDAEGDLQAALAELLVFEAVRLRLLVTAWSSQDYEMLGGDEDNIDTIVWEEVAAILPEPALLEPDVRGLPLMYASATVALARDASQRVEQLQNVGEDLREQLRVRARLRAILRELRLPESVLLENALAAVLGEERQELTDLQAARPLALEGLSRQAMDQRVSRGRKALTGSNQQWPRRRAPALFDLLREDE